MRNDRYLFPHKLTRRDFVALGTSAAVGAVAFGNATRIDGAEKAAPVTIGSGKWTYTLDPSWGQLPSGMSYGFGCAVVVDAQGRLANAVVILTGVKRPAAADTMVMNEKCRFAPRVQIAKPNATVRTTSKDPILHTTQAQLENGRTVFNVALPVPGINITKPIGGAGTVRLSCNTHPWMRGWVIVGPDGVASQSDVRRWVEL